MKSSFHGNHRPGHHPRLPKFITRCRLPCLRRYAESDSSSDIQQESLLERSFALAAGGESSGPNPYSSPWSYYGNDDARPSMELPGQEEEVEDEEIVSPASMIRPRPLQLLPGVSTPVTPQLSARPRPQSDTNSIDTSATSQFRMPRFNSRMWQDGFGRFHRDTIPRRDNPEEPTPALFHTGRSPVQSSGWFGAPKLNSMFGSNTNISLSVKSNSSATSSEGSFSIEEPAAQSYLQSETESYLQSESESCLPRRTPSSWQSFDDENQNTSVSHMDENFSTSRGLIVDQGVDTGPAADPINRPVLAFPNQRSMAEVLLSLPVNNPTSAHRTELFPSHPVTSTDHTYSNPPSQYSNPPSQYSNPPSQNNSPDPVLVHDQNRNHSQASSLETESRDNAHTCEQPPNPRSEGRPSLFDILERINNHLQQSGASADTRAYTRADTRAEAPDSALSEDAPMVCASQDRGNTEGSHDVLQTLGSRQDSSAASTVSSTSDEALIRHILWGLTERHEPTEAEPSTIQSEAVVPSTGQSAASNPSQPREEHNWYFYDPRLAPQDRLTQRVTMTTNHQGMRQSASVAGIICPPSYEEAQADATSPPDGMGIDLELLTRLGVLKPEDFTFPSDPPPPYPESDLSSPPYPDVDISSPPYHEGDIGSTLYPESDISSPPPYDLHSQLTEDSSSEAASNYTQSDVGSSYTQSDLVDLSDSADSSPGRMLVDSSDIQRQPDDDNLPFDATAQHVHRDNPFSMGLHTERGRHGSYLPLQSDTTPQHVHRDNPLSTESGRHGSYLPLQSDTTPQHVHRDNPLSTEPGRHGSYLPLQQSDTERGRHAPLHHVSSFNLGMSGRLPMRWNQQMRPERWASSRSWLDTTQVH